MKSILIITLLSLFLISMKSDKPAYCLFNDKGKPTSYQTLLEEAAKADIVMFGELHNVSICHWLQLELTKDLYQLKGKKLILGAEMFETDNQLLINEYLSGSIKEKNFETEVKLWPNYKTDYKPLLNFAKDSSLHFIATNVPRRYASMVNKSGFEALDNLDQEAYRLIADRPIAFDPELGCYKNMLKEMGESEHVSQTITMAQALKDATMAQSILRNWTAGSTFLHFNGTYHSDNYEGIVWYLKKSAPTLRILTISTVEQTDPVKLSEDQEGKGDYIIVIPEAMSRTY
ncbi:MAG: ChaN family lipoprotein [Bacteroidales bacterium]|nr:ChaN family lipoprotein [Bacteroidales bacterium]